MRLDLDHTAHGLLVTVTLSRRNLLALLHKVDWASSRKEMWNTDVWVDGEEAYGIGFRTRCEADAVHYGRRRQPAGPMHWATESFIRAVEGDPSILGLDDDGAVHVDREDDDDADG